MRVAPLQEETAQSPADDGWDVSERATLLASIAARRPFLDFALHRRNSDGSRQQFRVSGQPMFDQTCRFLGYRGIGVAMAPSA